MNAFQVHQSVMPENKKNQKTNNYLGVKYLKSAVEKHVDGAIQEAEELYKLTIKSGYLHYTALFNLGLINLKRGDIQEAIHFYTKTIHLYPMRKEPYNVLSELYLNIGELDKARSLITKLLQFDPVAIVHMQTLATFIKNSAI